MNVLFFHQSAELYGSDKVLLNIVDGLNRETITPIVLLPSTGPLFSELRERGIEVHVAEVLKISRSQFKPLGLLQLPLKILRSVSQVSRLLDGRRVDVVYSNTMAVLGGAVWSALHHARHVWHVHEIILKPRVVSKLLCKLVGWSADWSIANSNMTHQWLVETEPSLSGKCTVVWNGYSRKDAYKREQVALLRGRLGVAEGVPIVALVGRINSWKGQKLLVEAGTKLWEDGMRSVHYLIVGSPPPGQEHHLDELNTRIAESPARDLFTVWDFTDDIEAVWDLCDVAVVPSTEPEPFGMVAIEAMAAAKPVVAAGHGGLVDIVEDGRTGLLFRPSCVADLGNKLRCLLDDKSFMQGLGVAGKDRQQALFSCDQQVRRIEQLLVQKGGGCE